MVSGARDSPYRFALAEVFFSLFLCKTRPTVYMRIANPSRKTRQLWWASCLASGGSVTLAGRTTFFFQINTLARLTGATVGVASVTKFLDLGYKEEIRIEDVKLTPQNP